MRYSLLMTTDQVIGRNVHSLMWDAALIRLQEIGCVRGWLYDGAAAA